MGEASTYYQRAMEATHPDVVISNLDACLISAPVPQVAMFAYRNLAGAIWEKFNFNNRKGRTISNEEFWWAQRAAECLRRVVGIYESLSEYDRGEPDVRDCYSGSKEFLQVAYKYGLYYERYGKTLARDMKQSIVLPPLRCLDDSFTGLP